LRTTKEVQAMQCTNYVGYVFAQYGREGRSGLGLMTQQETLRFYVKRNDGRLLATYFATEQKDMHGELEKALRHARLASATLITTSLDRSSFSAAFLATLQAADFIIISANDATMGMMSPVTPSERDEMVRRRMAAINARA
jgi:hypothetical protein